MSFEKMNFTLNDFKGIVHPKKDNSVINYSPSHRSKPVRPSFIFGNTNYDIFDELSRALRPFIDSNHNQGTEM